MTIVRGLKLLYFMKDNDASLKYFIDIDALANKVSDQFIFACVKFNLYKKIVEIDTSSQIWSKLKIYYASQIRVRVKKLQIQSRTPE